MNVEGLYTMADDGLKHELQAGILLSEPRPGFRHGLVTATVTELLGRHVRLQALGVVLAGDPGFVLARDPDTLRGPDVAFVSKDRLPRAEDQVHAFEGAPDLAVEVLSPSNTRTAVHAKVADYLAAGTRLVWVIDPDPERETVTIYRSLLAPRTLSRDDELGGEDVVAGFRVTVAELFER